jgi:ankyrin repeat protein
MEHPEVVKVLLDNGAKVNEPSRFGGFPIGMAVAKENTRISRLLLEAGADPDRVSRNSGTSPRERAKQLGLDDIVKLMKKYDPPKKP